MPIITGVPKTEMDFIWVSGHWDVHLSGLCRYQGNICRFKCDNPDPNDDDIARYSIYSLSMMEKIHWLYRKKKFEICVGRHWTYPDRKNGTHFTRYKTRWLGALLWAWQYGDIRSAFRFYYRKR